MKILAQIDTSRDPREDSCRNEVWSLVDVFGSTLCIRIYTVHVYGRDHPIVTQYTVPELEGGNPEILQRLLDLL